MKFELPHYTTTIRYLAASPLIVFGLLSILATGGGGGGDGGAALTHVRIDIEDPSVDTEVNTATADLSGTAECPECPPLESAVGICPFIICPTTTEIDVSWLNHATGESGGTFQSILPVCGCLFSSCVSFCEHRWSALSVPLAIGANAIEVTASDASGNSGSASRTITRVGPYIPFESFATNLVPNDTNGIEDIFVYDFQTGTTMRVSVDSSGNESTGGVGSNRPGISADGRYVAFESSATNLVGASDTNGDGDIFVHDRQTGATIRVSVDSSGNQANGSSGRPAISADGRFVAFESLAQNLVAGGTLFKQIFVHDIQTGLTTLVSVDNSSTQGNADSALATISGDGRFVAFVSLADNLVAGDTNGTPDIFVHDRQTGTTSRVSVDSSGNESNGTNPNSPDISADGRFVAFQSDATDLVAGDTNGVVDVFVHDRQTGTTTRISVDSAGTEGNAQSREPSLSADGRFVAFHSDANLVAGDTNGLSDIYLHDRQTGVTSRISLPAIGIDTNGNSFRPRISPDGQFVVFQSVADNLISLDQNALSDVFVHDLQTGITTRISVDSSGTEATGGHSYVGT